MKSRISKISFAQAGILLGITFPIGGIIIDLVWNDLGFSWASISQLYARGPIHWIVLTSPIVLGFVFQYFNRKVNSREEELLTEQKKNVDQLTNIESFINDIEKGDFADKAYSFENTQLATLLSSMKLKLWRQKEEDEKSKWVSEGLARFGEIFHHHTDLEPLTNEVIKNLVKYLEMNQGSILILNESNPKELTLDLKACYAYDRKKYGTKSVRPGEGLVGQCYLENDTIILKQVPREYIKITSGLGDAPPSFILIVPIKTNEKSEGVLELAAFAPLEKYQIKFIEKVCEGLATVVHSLKVNEHTKKLLESTQTQAEQLRTQEEEMRQNMEELQATQEAMERKSLEADEKSRKLNAILDSAADGIATITEEGYLETVNAACTSLFGYTSEELMGATIDMIIPEPEQDRQKQNSKNRVLTTDPSVLGETRCMKGTRKDGSRFPIELALNVTEIGTRKMFTAIIRDISDRVQLEAQRQEQLEELRAQEEELRQNMEEVHAIQENLAEQLVETKKMRTLAETRETVLGLTTILSETDLYGTITFVNDKFCEVAKYNREELIGKPHNVVRHPDMPKELFKLFWETIQDGRVFKGIVKNRCKDGTHYWVDATIVPIKDETGKTVKFVGARYHITDEELALKLYNQQAEKMKWPKLGGNKQVDIHTLKAAS